MKKKEIDNLARKHSVLSKIIEFFKKIFKLDNNNILISETSSAEQKATIQEPNFKKDIKIENNDSEKNITMFFYKQLRLGKLDSKYIPDQYLEKISALLKEEKKIKQKEIKNINEEIALNEQKIKKYNEESKL